MLEDLASSLLVIWREQADRARTTQVVDLAISELRGVTKGSELGLSLGALGDKLRGSCKPLAEALYRRSADLLLKQSMKKEGLLELLAAALGREKARQYGEAVAIYDQILLHLRSVEWISAVRAMRSRCLAKQEEEWCCMARAAAMFEEATALYRKAVAAAQASEFLGKWLASVDEMASRANACRQKLQDAANKRTLQPGSLWSFWQIWRNINLGKYSSSIYEPVKATVLGEGFLVTGGMHANEIAGPLASLELMGLLDRQSYHLVVWPCMDLVGYLGAPDFHEARGRALPKPWPHATARCEEREEFQTILVQPTADAPPDWLAKIALFVSEERKDLFRFVVWQSAVNENDAIEPLPCRAFEITQKGLGPLWDPSRDKLIGATMKLLFEERNPKLWLDLHEARGTGFHVYVANATGLILDMAKMAVAAAEGQVPINEEIWNRQSLDRGIFALPQSAMLCHDERRVVLEVGEELPLSERVDTLSRAVITILQAASS